jgi:hypothetical protein
MKSKIYTILWALIPWALGWLSGNWDFDFTRSPMLAFLALESGGFALFYYSLWGRKHGRDS